MITESSPLIMVIDDDFDVLFTTSANLTAAGYKVSKFNLPEQAIETLKTEKFDVILSDINMPKYTGMDILDAVKMYAPDTPLIFMTGYADLDTAMQAIKKGAFDLLTKPVDYEILKIVINKAAKVRQARIFELTYQDKLEDEILRVTAELRNSMELLEFTNGQLASAMEAKDVFLSTISHELRTPMNGVVGALSILADTVAEKDNLDLIDMASRAAAEMCSIVDRIITFTALKSSSVATSVVRFSLPERLSLAVAGYIAISQRKGVNLVISVDPSLHAILQGDVESYLLVVDSLVSNAVKFTSKGEISVSISAEASDGGNSVSVLTSIRDSGVGIPEEKYEMIFQEFGQGDGSLKRAFGGLGIGLNTASLVIERLKGKLWFESTAGEGTTFHFIIPFQKVD